jgi:hypothetical protein
MCKTTKETLKMSTLHNLADPRPARRYSLLPLLLAALCCFLGIATPTAGAAPAPAWKMAGGAFPTNFYPGQQPEHLLSAPTPEYNFLATNVGAVSTSGPIVFTDTLPVGLTAFEPEVRVSEGYGGGFSPAVPCAVTGQTVTCEVEETTASDLYVRVTIPVEVALNAPSSVTNEAVISGGGGGTASTTVVTQINESNAPFEFVSGSGGLSATASQNDGTPSSQAGSHPYQLTIDTGFSSKYEALREGVEKTLRPSGHPRDIRITLPRGVAINPQATPVKCTEAQLESYVASAECPPASQIGLISIKTETGAIYPFMSRLYNMVPPPGVPAELAFDGLGFGFYIHLLGHVNSAGEYELSASSNETIARPLNAIFGIQAQLWGNPSGPSHDTARGAPLDPSNASFITMPTACGSATLQGEAVPWEDSSDLQTASAQFEDSEGNPVGVFGCNALQFNPMISSKATTNLADSPSGLDFNLHQPQNLNYEGIATASLKDARVILPAGLFINPSSANGLSACGEAQIGLTTPVGQASPIHFSEQAQSCPDAAKLGTVEIRTPLLDHKLPGAIYLAKPYENPFANLTAIYLAIEDEESGIVSKLAGKITPDPITGQLSATFTENPELPIEDIDLHFFKGARAALTTPLTCGTKTTTSVLTPWSTPEGADATPTDSFQTQVAAGGSGTCPSSEANAPNAPAFTAGTIAPQAGAYSPFVLKLSRPDGTQRLTGIDTTLPKGLIGKLAGIPYCSDAQIAQAQARSNPNQGALEQSNPSCPQASEVGTVTVGAGSGPTPTYVSGHAYLAGPYKGAPLSLAIITPAVAGPFDLGTVLVRTALYINSETAQIHAVSDPFPSILQGIPLDLRSVALKMDRPSFTLNPTSCDPKSLTGSATALTGQSAALTSPFQVGGCNALKFSPKLKISLKGGTKRHRFPALKAVLTYPKGNYANIASAQVTLPHSAFLEQGHIGTVCTRVQFAADACPAKSIYGKARAITPLLDQPLEGPVYLRSSSHELPDLVAALNGQIDVDLVGRIDTGKGGGIRNTFEAVPDAPVSKFVLEMKGGKKGLLVNSEDICRKPQRATVSFTGQNGKVSDTTPLIANSCGGKAKKKGSGGKTGGKGK